MIATWIVYSLFVTACAAAVAHVIEVMWRASGRPTRWLWAATFTAAVAMPALVAVRPRAVMPAVPMGEVSLPDVSVATPAAGPTMSLDAWLGLAWGLAALGVGLLLAVGLAQLARARRRAVPGVLAGRVVAVTPDLGPGALPFGEPKILVPHWVSSLPADAARLLVAHEEQHVRAGDARLLVGAAVVLAAMPWNVVLWWSLRRLRTAIELDCDARVLHGEPAVGPYAELLLQVAGRGRSAPALLALTDSTSQLKTRIDAMTTSRMLSPVRRAALAALGIAAVVAACEARRPEPVAPVTDYVVTEGRATALAGSPQLAESVKVRVDGSMKSADPGAVGGDGTKPMLLVHDARGKVVYAGRVDSARVLDAIPPSEIATVDVVKRGDLLPAEARGGLVSVVLKPEATWTPPAPPDSSWHYKSPAVSAGDRPAIEETDSLAVRLEEASGAVLYEGPWAKPVGQGAGPYTFSPDDISRIDIRKDGADKKVTITLKEGAKVGKR